MNCCLRITGARRNMLSARKARYSTLAGSAEPPARQAHAEPSSGPQPEARPIPSSSNADMPSHGAVTLSAQPSDAELSPESVGESLLF